MMNEINYLQVFNQTSLFLIIVQIKHIKIGFVWIMGLKICWSAENRELIKRS